MTDSPVPPPEAKASSDAAPAAPSKMAPDDPRLRLGRARGRTLKKGPAIALVAAVSGVVLCALTLALEPPSPPGPSPKPEPESTASPQPPVVPQPIRDGTPMPPPPGDRLLVVALPDAGIPLGRRATWREGDSREPSSDGAERQHRREQDRQAAQAGVLFEARGSDPGSAGPSPSPAPSTPLALLSNPGRSAGPGLAVDTDPNLQERKNAFLSGEGSPRDSLSATLQHPKSAYQLQAGTIIPALLVTGINSDLPGPVVGQVRENVYDSVSGNSLLIPQGARLLASYDSMVAWGQERVLLCWNRLVFPNGDSLNLECMPTADLAGAAGLTDSVDEHWARILAGAAVATLLASGTTLAAGNTEGFNPTVAQTMAHNAAGEVNRVGQQITGRALNIQPTITVRPGFSVNVMVTKDIVLPPYRNQAAR